MAALLSSCSYSGMNPPMDHSESVWQSPPQPLHLVPGEVHVWLHGIDSAAGADTVVLSETERKRAARLLQPRARAQYTAAHSILRITLGRYLTLDPSTIRFSHGPAGKPFLDPVHGHDLRFNLAHSAKWLVIAYAHGKEIGVDVEHHRTLDPMPLAQRFFCAAEATRLQALDPPQRSRSFFSIWTAKEALAKAMGTGIAGTLNRFEITVTEAGITWHDRHRKIAPERWSLYRLPAPQDYSAALAIDQGIEIIRCFSVP